MGNNTPHYIKIDLVIFPKKKKTQYDDSEITMCCGNGVVMV
jgi:hypothetical protein